MIIDALGSFLTTFVNILFWFFTFSKRHLSSLAKAYFWWSFYITVWSFGYGITLSGWFDYDTTLVWNKFCQAMATMIAPYFFRFGCEVAHRFDENKKIFRFYLIFGIVNALVLFFTPYYVKGLWSFGYYRYQPLGGPLYIVFTLFFFWCTIHSFIVAARAYPKMAGRASKQLKLFLLGTGIAYSGGGTLFLQGYGLAVPTWGVYLILGYVIIIAYAIHKYQFMDISELVRKTLVFAGLFGMVMAVVGIMTALMQHVLAPYLPIHPFVSMTLSVFAAILLYDPTKRWLIHVTENVLFQQEIDYDAIDREIADQIQITDLAAQARNIVEIFQKRFVLEHAAILLLDEEKKQYRFAYEAGGQAIFSETELDEAHPFISFLQAQQNNIVLKSSVPTSDETFGNFFPDWRLEVVCKIPFKETLIAVLLLGKKKSDREFTNRDAEFLERVSKSLGVSINNAKTFKFKEDYYVLMAEKNKTDVLARLSEGIDHEIKNPLNAIKPAAQRIQGILQKTNAGEGRIDAKVPEYLDMIVRNTDRIIQIMARLRNFARPIRAAADFKLSPLRLRELVDEAIELVSRKQLELDSVEVKVEVDDNIGIFGEHASVVQVFWNLIVNAHHAIDKNGIVAIKAWISEGDGTVRISVSDTGKGIAPEHLEKIFTPFFTTKPTNLPPDGRERFTGTGLGLCYVKQYIEGLGGSINCESKLGKGTTFYLKFLRAESGQRQSQNITC